MQYLTSRLTPASLCTRMVGRQLLQADFLGARDGSPLID